MACVVSIRLIFLILLAVCCQCSGGGSGNSSESENGSSADAGDASGSGGESATDDSGETEPNSGAEETEETSATVSEDAQPPANLTPADFINDGNVFTLSAAILLSLSATDEYAVSSYYVAEGTDQPATNAEGWISLATTTTAYQGDVTYEIQSGLGEKTLSVWFKDVSDNISEPVSDSIIYIGSALHEVSYYPKDYGWEEMWTQWPVAKLQMDDDLAEIAALGVNTVRIFIMPDIFGFPSPSATYLGYLDEALSLIAEHGMRTHINLFDCWYSHADVSGSLQWLQAVLQEMQDDDRIAVWELQNEMNLGDATIRSWLTQVFPTMKELAGEAYATVSVVDPGYLDDIAALTAPHEPELYSLHWYPDGDFQWTNFLGEELSDALAVIGDAELLVGEFGYPAYRYSEESQAKLYRDVFYTSQELGIDHLGFWTFTDFPAGTPQCGGVVPADTSQFYYGVLDISGSQRESASVIEQVWTGEGIDQPAQLGPDNVSFESLNPAGYAYNWITWDQNWSGAQRYVQDCTLARTGSCSARIDSAANISVGFYSAPAVKIDPAKSYGVSAFIRTESLSGSVQLTFSWYSWNGVSETWIGNSSSAPITAGNLNTWTALNLNGITPPANAELALVFVQVLSTTTGSKVWVDDVGFAEQ